MRTILTVSVLAALLAGTTCAAPPARAGQSEMTDQAAREFTVAKKLVFSQTDPPLTLDLYLPKPLRKPVPCIMTIQGGGFAPQSGSRFRPFAEYLARNRFAAALISYRGRPDYHYRDTIADTKAAVRYVRKISRERGIDPNRIGAMGRSAGGTLTALLAVTGGMKEFEGTGGSPGYSSRIQAAVTYAGVFDFVARFSDKKQLAMMPGWKSRILSNGAWIGTPFDVKDKHWQAASAIRHVDKSDAPMLLMHCKDDPKVPWLQSEAMCRALQAAGIKARTLYYPKGGHSFRFKDRQEPMKPMLAFFREVLMNQPATAPKAPKSK